jgi:hypothetical protein
VRSLRELAALAIAAAAFGGLAAAPAPAAWPVSPIGQQQPVRGGFLDPRWAGAKRGWSFHAAIDVAVREDVPTGAPEGFVRKVYAIAEGTVRRTTVTPTHRCGSVRIGRVQYGHVDLLQVRVGDRVRVGRWIGWSCRGQWHVHIAEFDRQGRKLNPFRPGGVLEPHDDAAAPVIREVKVVDGELRAQIEDPQSFTGWFELFPRLYDDLPPYRIDLDGVTLRKFFRVPTAPFEQVYAPETFRNLTAAQCLATDVSCAGEHWFRLGKATPGKHLLEAWDASGNHVRANLFLTLPPRTVGG